MTHGPSPTASDLPRDAQGEPIFSLPGMAMAATTVVGGLCCAALAAGAGWLAEHSAATQATPGTWVGCAVGAGIALIGNALGLLVLWPGAHRAATIWTGVWMAAAAVRMVATAGLAALLYFPSLGEPKAFVLATGLTYLVLLVAETLAVAKRLGPVLGSHAGVGRSKGNEPSDHP